MTVAILALAFREPAVLAAAVPVYRAAGCDIYVHLDAKVPVADYKAAMGPMSQECVFLPERRSIYWAGFTMVRAMLDLMGAALAGGSYGNFALVSDDSFPVRAPWLLNAKLTTDHERIAVRRVDENELFAQRYRNFYCFDHQATSLHGRPIESAVVDDRFLAAMHRLEERRKVGKADLPLFYGSQWWSLTEAAVRLIVELDATREDLRESFEFSAVPDEMYFQSLLMSFSPAMKRVESPMLVDWTRQPKPFVFQKFEDVQSRIGEDHCFIRKVSARHPELLEQLRQSVLPQEAVAEAPREAGAA
jgi:hypothetical protein